ncbi:MAG: response regulator [Bacteroidales bacterium]|nr:MAG: response regulator [Bacteroidales bacterium]
MEELVSVLYVDDEPMNLMLFNINFKKKYNVITALSGEEGLEKLSQNPKILVVISDMKMPGMNGIEFISQAKKSYPNIIFYILTGYDITPEIAQALKDKLINHYFSKPFNIDEIEQSISLSIGKSI